MRLRSSPTRNHLGTLLIVSMGVFGVGLAAAGVATQLQLDAPALPLVIAGATLAVLAVGLMRLTRGRVAVVAADEARAGDRTVPLAEVESVKLTWWADRTARTSRQGGQGRRDSGWLVALDGGALPSPLVVLDTADELTAWRTAEQLARQLDVPMIDDTGESPAARAVAELDVPLADWLARQPDVPAPGDPPAPLTVTDSPEAWRAEHPGLPRRFFAVVAAADVFLMVTMPLVAAQGGFSTPDILLLIFLGAFIPVSLLWFAHVCSRRAVEVTATELVLHGPFPLRRRAMPLTHLERIRLTPQGMHVVSDRTVLRLPLVGEHGRFIRQSVLHRLRRPAAPYR